MSAAIDGLSFRPEYLPVRREYLREGVTCSGRSGNGDLQQITVSAMSGVWFGGGGFALLALCVAICLRLAHTHRAMHARGGAEGGGGGGITAAAAAAFRGGGGGEDGDEEFDPSVATEGEMLRALFKQVQRLERRLPAAEPSAEQAPADHAGEPVPTVLIG